MKNLIATALVILALMGPQLGKVTADWDPGGGGYPGYYEPPPVDPGPSDWTCYYYAGC